MKHLCCNRVIFLFLLLSFSLLATERYAFVYNDNIDDRFVNFYDKVVVEADAIDNIYAMRYPDKLVAYVSVGEIEPWRKTKTPYDKSWIISKNKTWNSLIADLNKKGYRNFLFERIEKLYMLGYRNFFLDTMDAYHVTLKNKKLFALQQKSLIGFIHTLRSKYPKAKIILNRGFELLGFIHKEVDAVVAESLIARYDHSNKAYIPVPKNDREWLLNNLRKAQKYGLDAISIDYSDSNTSERRKIAQKIKKLGIIPYVSDGLLQEQGECEKKRIRRDILILLNQSILHEKNDVYSDVHLVASMPIEHFGYVPVLYDISTKKLPKRIDDKYHAVIVWSNGQIKESEKIYAWAKKIKAKGIKILFMNHFWFKPNKERLETFNMAYEKNSNPFIDKAKTLYEAPYNAYEIKASIPFEDNLIVPDKETKAVLKLLYSNGQMSTPIGITPWGGYAFNESYLTAIGEENLWTIDPFKFFQQTLDLNNIPVPDPTTESGRRILFTHVDGDGFMETVRMDREKLSVEYLIEHIYKKYPIPQTLSLIQGEVDSIGLYPKLSPRMKKITRELYRLPWVQPASHTLSHPFFWNELKQKGNDNQTEYQVNKGKHKKGEHKKGEHKLYHLAVPNYKFSLPKETKESVAFALSLAPKNKQNEKILFWSGDCLPTKKTLAYVEREGILTMNGGDTTIKKSAPWMSRVAPYGLQRGHYWQIYTAQQNENVYTNDWLGPYWGYRDVIDTFKLTESPRRLKAMNIYYHFYSGSRLASLKAVEEAYAWAMKQKTTKLYASQYIKKGRGFYRTSIEKIDDGFRIRNSGFLRTLRFDYEMPIDIESSKGVAGYIYEKNRTYITLDTRGEYKLQFGENLSVPHLIESNGWVKSIDVKNNQYHFYLQANMPIEASFYLPKNCTYRAIKQIKLQVKKEQLFLKGKKEKGARIVFSCR